MTTHLQQQKLVWSVRLLDSKVLWFFKSTIVEISVVCQTNIAYLCKHKRIYNSRNQCGLLDVRSQNTAQSYLQQQKLVWSVRPDAENLSRIKSTIVEISVVCQTLCSVPTDLFIYNSRNQCGLLDTNNLKFKHYGIYNSRNQCGLLDDSEDQN